jgi:hypothetical protein
MYIGAPKRRENHEKKKRKPIIVYLGMRTIVTDPVNPPTAIMLSRRAKVSPRFMNGSHTSLRPMLHKKPSSSKCGIIPPPQQPSDDLLPLGPSPHPRVVPCCHLRLKRSFFPSGENDTEMNKPSSRGAPIFRPVFKSHSHVVLSAEAAASVAPSGQNATEKTG